MGDVDIISFYDMTSCGALKFWHGHAYSAFLC